MPRCSPSSTGSRRCEAGSHDLSDSSLVLFERDQRFVIERLREGEVDYIDAISELSETEFFRAIQAKGYLGELADTYPLPRKKEEVPTWFYLSSNLSMRLHGVSAFHAYPYIVRAGGMLNAFGPDLGRKTTHPETGDVTLSCNGFNEKNEYDRQTPCDQDYLRKVSKDTNPDKLHAWFNRDIGRLFKKHKLFDPRGCFIGDGTYLFVPDNEKYEKSARMLFDENEHPVEKAALEKMSPQAAARCRWRRCYKLVSLLYVDPSRTFWLRAGIRVVPGNDHECPVLYQLVDELVEALGEGVINRLLLDRGFIDGAAIERCKREHGIDVLIPVRRNMDIYQDVLGLVRAGEVRFLQYQRPVRPPVDEPRLPSSPEPVRKRELKRQKTVAAKKAKQPKQPPLPPSKTLVRQEVGAVDGLRSLDSCKLPLNAIVNRDIYADGSESLWVLIDTKPLTPSDGPASRRAEYAIRTDTEEGHRLLKCFWDLTGFRSCRFSMVLNQVVFVLLAFNLLQVHLRATSKARPDLARRTIDRVRDLLMPTATVIVIYCQNRFATLTTAQYSEELLTLDEAPRQKLLQRVRALREQLGAELHLARPP